MYNGSQHQNMLCPDLNVINPKVRYIFLHDFSFSKHKQATVSQLPTTDYPGLYAELLVIEIIVTEIGVVVLYSAAVCLERLRVEVSEPCTVNLHFRFHAECLSRISMSISMSVARWSPLPTRTNVLFRLLPK